MYTSLEALSTSQMRLSSCGLISLRTLPLVAFTNWNVQIRVFL